MNPCATHTDFSWGGCIAMTINKRNVLQALIALFVVFAINSTEILVVGAESDSTLLNFVSKFAYSISTVNIVDVLSWIGIYVLISYIFKEEKFKIDVAGLVVAIILTFLYMWCFCYKLSGDASALFANSYQVFLTTVRFIGHTILFYTGFCGIYGLLSAITFEKNDKSARVFIISASLIFIG